MPGVDQRLAGDAALGVARHHGVEDRVGDLVADLVGVTLGDRLGREQVLALGERLDVWHARKPTEDRDAVQAVPAAGVGDEVDHQRHALEAVGLAHPVLEVVGPVADDQAAVVDLDREARRAARRPGPRSRGAGAGRGATGGGVVATDVGDEAVQLRRRDPLAARSASASAFGQQAGDVAPAQRRAGDDLGPQAQLARDPGAGVVDVGRVDVPLVEHEQRRAAGPHRQLGDAQVLGGDARRRRRRRRSRRRRARPPLGAQLRVVVDRAGDLGAAPQAGGVDQQHRPPVDLELGVDRVAGRAGALGDDHPLGAEEGVDQRGLADVGAADRPRRGRRPRRPPRRGALAEQLDQRGRAGRRVPRPCVAETAIGSPRPSPWNSAAEVLVAGAVDLVDDDEDGDVGAAQRLRQLGVAGAQPGAAVDDQQDDVGLGDRRSAPGAARPRPARSRRRGRCRRCRAARRRRRSTRRARRLRSRVTPGSAWVTASRAAGEAVDQGALADVGEADDRDGRQAAHRRCGPRLAARGATTCGRRPRPTRAPVVSISTASVGRRAGRCARGSASRSSRCALRGEHRVASSSPLCGGAAAGALLGGGGEEDLQRRVGADHGADVAALGDVAAGGDQLPLPCDHRLAHLAGGRRPARRRR